MGHVRFAAVASGGRGREGGGGAGGVDERLVKLAVEYTGLTVLFSLLKNIFEIFHKKFFEKCAFRILCSSELQDNDKTS